MLIVTIPDSLTIKINEFASLAYQTPEECVIELLLDRIDHDSAVARVRRVRLRRNPPFAEFGGLRCAFHSVIRNRQVLK